MNKPICFKQLCVGTVIATCLAMCMIFASMSAAAEPSPLVNIVGNGESDLFAVPFDQYKGDLARLPIGVFDSGIGGLTVLAEILKVDSFDNATHERGADGRPDFENERFVYLGDQANMPYGNYPGENKTDMLKEHIVKDAVFLLGNRYRRVAGDVEPQRDKPLVKAIVIACNTATAYGLEDVRAALETWGVPVYLVGVVEAGAKGAVEIPGMDGDNAVAVMATVGTCNSGGYPRAIERIAGAKGVSVPQVSQQGSLGLAGAVEGNELFITDPSKAATTEYQGPSVTNPKAPILAELAGSYAFEADGLLGEKNNPATWRLNSVENYIRYDVTMLVDRHAKKENARPVSAVILGCTHFPFYVDRIAASFERLRTYEAPDGSRPYAHAIAETVTFIDPAKNTAEECYQALADMGRLVPDGSVPVIMVDEFFLSVPNPLLRDVPLTETGGFTYEYKYGRIAGNLDVEYVHRVPMSGKNLSTHVQESIRDTMPGVWERLVRFNRESPRAKGLERDDRLR